MRIGFKLGSTNIGSGATAFGLFLDGGLTSVGAYLSGLSTNLNCGGVGFTTTCLYHGSENLA